MIRSHSAIFSSRCLPSSWMPYGCPSQRAAISLRVYFFSDAVSEVILKCMRHGQRRDEYSTFGSVLLLFSTFSYCSQLSRVTSHGTGPDQIHLGFYDWITMQTQCRGSGQKDFFWQLRTVKRNSTLSPLASLSLSFCFRERGTRKSMNMQQRHFSLPSSSFFLEENVLSVIMITCVHDFVIMLIPYGECHLFTTLLVVSKLMPNQSLCHQTILVVNIFSPP